MARALGGSGALWTCSYCLWGWAPAFLQAPNKAVKQPDYLEVGCVHLCEPPLPLPTPDFLSELGLLADLETQPSRTFVRLQEEQSRRAPRGDLTADAAPLTGWVSTVVSGLGVDTGKRHIKIRKSKRCEGSH